MTGFYFIDFLKSSENQKIRTRAFAALTTVDKFTSLSFPNIAYRVEF